MNRKKGGKIQTEAETLKNCEGDAFFLQSIWQRNLCGLTDGWIILDGIFIYLGVTCDVKGLSYGV